MSVYLFLYFTLIKGSKFYFKFAFDRFSKSQEVFKKIISIHSAVPKTAIYQHLIQMRLEAPTKSKPVKR
jgi:hypothetical protein